MSKLWKEIIKGVFAVIVVAVGGYFALRKAKAEPTLSVKVDSGSAVVVGKDVNQNGNQNIVAGRDVKVSYGDTNKTKAGRAGDTYNVKSDHQTGGITAGKVELYNVTVVTPGENKDSLSSPNNYQFQVDSVHKIISVHPKYGSWTKTFIGIPKSEKSEVQPHFMNSIREIRSMKTDSILFQGDSLYFIASNADPASEDISYSLHYVSLPHYLVFGNYPKPLYKAVLR